MRLDTAVGTRIHGFHPDHLAPRVDDADPKWSATQLLKDDRDGPEHLWQLSSAAIRRWHTPTDRLGGEAYRPETLPKVAGELEALGPWHFEPLTDLIAVETVKAGDFLSSYAHRHYGDAPSRAAVRSAAATTAKATISRASLSRMVLPMPPTFVAVDAGWWDLGPDEPRGSSERHAHRAGTDKGDADLAARGKIFASNVVPRMATSTTVSLSTDDGAEEGPDVGADALNPDFG